MYAMAAVTAEDKAELLRLRNLLQLNALRKHPAFAARVIASRFGPMSVRKTFTVNKGFLDGATVGTPVAVQGGAVGRIMRSAPHTATVLMITDPEFRLAVISQNSRTPGILTGSADGTGRLEVSYVSQTSKLTPGEMLVSSGESNDFPKGIPVGTVTNVEPGNETLFQKVHASPLADLERLEEVLLIEHDGPPLLYLPGPPEPELTRLRGPAPQEYAPDGPDAGQTGLTEQARQPAAPSAGQTGLTEQNAPPAAPLTRPPARTKPKKPSSPSAVLDSLQPDILQTAPGTPRTP